MRSAVVVGVLLLSSGCQLPEPEHAGSDGPSRPPAAVVQPPLEPAPLPPEETPPPEASVAPKPPEPKPVEPGITATGAPTRGRLPKPVIDQKLSEVQPAILACYQSALRAKPGLRGTVDVDFVVSPEGKVAHASAAATEDALPDDGTVACILAEIEKLEFPPPTGGRVFVHYPIKLEPPKP